MVEFSKTFLLLQQEAYLIQSALLSGLHHLRNARQDTKGHFYTAFFQLSIGLERLMKASFIINYMREHEMAAPTDQQLRDFGHDLVTLFDHLAILNIPDASNPLQEIMPESIERDILSFLARFAKRTRYHNIDSLVKEGISENPLVEWSSVICRALQEDVRDCVKRRISQETAVYTSVMQEVVIVAGVDLHGCPLNLAALYSRPRYDDIAAGHLVNHTLVLIRALVRQLDDVSRLVLNDPRNQCCEKMPIPYMHEFFEFIHYTKAKIIRKRRWP